MVTMEVEYKVVCALSNSTTFDDLEWPRTPVSRSQYTLKANISLRVHPIHSMSGSKMAADGYLGMTALSRVTLASAGLSCWFSGDVVIDVTLRPAELVLRWVTVRR